MEVLSMNTTIKKISTLLVLCMFLIMIPATLAEEDTGESTARKGVQKAQRATKSVDARLGDVDKRLERLEVNTGKAIKRFQEKAGVTEEAVQEFKEKREKRLEWLKNKRVELGQKGEARSKKVEEKRDFLQARQDVKERKEAYKKSLGEFRQSRGLFTAAKEEHIGTLRKCKVDDEETAECKAAREDFVLKARPFFMNSAKVLVEYLERVKANLDATEDLSEEEADALVSGLNEQITQAEDALAEAEGLDETATLDEIVELSKSMRALWKEAKPQVKVSLGRSMNARITTVLKKAEKVQEKLTTQIAELEAQGKDVSSLNEEKDAFALALRDVQSLQEEALVAFDKGDAKQGHQKLKDARKQLETARKHLRQVVHAVKTAE
jgi:DNA repair exonuclease SbcCD ATPase subunit